MSQNLEYIESRVLGYRESGNDDELPLVAESDNNLICTPKSRVCYNVPKFISSIPVLDLRVPYVLVFGGHSCINDRQWSREVCYFRDTWSSVAFRRSSEEDINPPGRPSKPRMAMLFHKLYFKYSLLRTKAPQNILPRYIIRTSIQSTPALHFTQATVWHSAPHLMGESLPSHMYTNTT